MAVQSPSVNSIALSDQYEPVVDKEYPKCSGHRLLLNRSLRWVPGSQLYDSGLYGLGYYGVSSAFRDDYDHET